MKPIFSWVCVLGLLLANVFAGRVTILGGGGVPPTGPEGSVLRVWGGAPRWQVFDGVSFVDGGLHVPRRLSVGGTAGVLGGNSFVGGSNVMSFGEASFVWNARTGALTEYDSRIFSVRANRITLDSVTITNLVLSGGSFAAHLGTRVAVGSIPGPGAEALTGTNVVISGATVNYLWVTTGASLLSMGAGAPRYNYSVLLLGTNRVTFGANMVHYGTWTPGWTNTVTIGPCTGVLWRVVGARVP